MISSADFHHWRINSTFLPRKLSTTEHTLVR